MIQLVDVSNYVFAFVLAAVLGGVGGIVYELLLPVRRRTGTIELPSRVGPRHIDLGIFASVIIGAVAAMAALWIFPPDVQITVDDSGESVTSTTYDLIKLVGLSLIVGTAGSSFISAIQARALAVVKSQEAAAKTQQAQATERVAVGQLTSISESVSNGLAPADLAESLRGAIAAVRAVNSTSSGNPTEGDF